MIMEDTLELQLEVWREVGRCHDLRTLTSRLHDILWPEFPVAMLILQRFHASERRLEAAVRSKSAGSNHAVTSPMFSPSDWIRIQAWAQGNDICQASNRSTTNLVEHLIPSELRGDVLVAPLKLNNHPLGILILEAAPGQFFEPSHVDILKVLLESFAVALENDRQHRELVSLREEINVESQLTLNRLQRQDSKETIVGAEAGLRHVMDRVELVAQSDVPVLILGETGTGKEVVSRAIHSRSKRADGPFIRVNCGAIPPELIDSQLFGHEKGSFTGAAAQHQGWFERADGGTLFLDEIGELPLPAQVRLLRVLQDHQVERIGGKSAIHVDVRIVAATHRDLATMVKSRTFREDLWYRINVFPILLPRLCERKDDIPALVRHFVQRAAHRFGLPAVDATPADLRLLMNYHWPGNIRELGAVIDRAAILGNGKTLEVTTALGLSQPLPQATPASNEPVYYEVIPEVVQPLVPASQPSAPISSLDQAMKEHIERTLVATGGQIEGKRGAAAILEINPHTLRARMRKLGVDWGKFR